MSCACPSELDDQDRKQFLTPILFQREREAIIELLIEAGFPPNAHHGPGLLQMAAGMHPTPAVLLRPPLTELFIHALGKRLGWIATIIREQLAAVLAESSPVC